MRTIFHILTHRLAPVLIRVWVVLWVLSVPLFHIHPELAEASGLAGAVRSGTVHTVFSGDLDGEFTPHKAAAHPATDRSFHLSHTWFEHAELGFSLITDSHHRTEFTPHLVHTMGLPFESAVAIRNHGRATEQLAAVPATTLFTHDLSSRAPPSLLL
jgi:hypothetical protein